MDPINQEPNSLLELKKNWFQQHKFLRYLVGIFMIVLSVVLYQALQYGLHYNIGPDGKVISQQSNVDWKTFSVDQYGFEFKYPNDWQIGLDSNVFLLGVRFEQNLGPTFYVVEDPFTPCEEDCVKTEDQTFPGGRAKVYFQHYPGEKAYIKSIIFKKNNINYVFVLRTNEAYTADALDDKVLSTFKFTNQPTTSFQIPPTGFDWQVVAEKDRFFKDGQAYYDDYKKSYGRINFTGKEWVLVRPDDKNGPDLPNNVDAEGTKLLEKDGWQFLELSYKNYKITPLEADGANGGDWGFVKLENGKLKVLLFGVYWDEHGSSPEGVAECPCDNYEYRVFLSDPVDVDSVLPK